jgi:hypothetical protein
MWRPFSIPSATPSTPRFVSGAGRGRAHHRRRSHRHHGRRRGAARRRALHVITDINPYRLELARKLGVTLAVDANRTKLSEVQKQLGMTEGFDVGWRCRAIRGGVPRHARKHEPRRQDRHAGHPHRRWPSWRTVIFRMLTEKGHGRLVQDDGDARIGAGHHARSRTACFDDGIRQLKGIYNRPRDVRAHRRRAGTR